MGSRSSINRRITFFLFFLLVAGPLPMRSVQAQERRVIIVNAEQPNLWTLEQAHYLLAQMHRRNLDLRAKSLEQLDPNEIAGLRFDVMRMLVEFGATFNQADLATNRLLSENRTFNAERRQELLTERDGLRRESVNLAGEIEALQTEKATTEDKDAQKVLEARIAAKTNRLTRVDKEIETLNGELATLNAPSGQPTATTGGATFDASKLPKSDFDEAFKAAAAKQIDKFNQSPQLNASLKLDNFLQMQYEIISKQLSLLRDELGPGERLVFLELPQTVNASHHESNKKWAQSWWKIAGYTRRERVGNSTPIPAATPAVLMNQQPVTTSQDVNSILSGEAIPLPIQGNHEPSADAPQRCTAGSPFHYSDTNAIRITDSRRSPKPNPLSFEVKAPGKVTNVTITIRGFRHSYPDDVDMLLVGPEGQNAIIWSDVGGSTAATDLTITLSDTAATPLPDVGPPLSQSYRPGNFGLRPDVFPLGTPAPLGGSALSIFNGTNAKGVWRLYLMDDADATDNGSIAGGWSLDITTDCVPPSPALQVAYQDKFFNLGDAVGVVEPGLNSYLTMNRSDLSNRIVRTVELIPRQNSLNVNDMKLETRAGAFNFVLSTLFGFGSQLKAQRQREQFSQFVQQELYSEIGR